MESHLSRPPLTSLQGNRTWRFQRLAWTRGAPGALPWTSERDVGAACIHNSLYVHTSITVWRSAYVLPIFKARSTSPTAPRSWLPWIWRWSSHSESSFPARQPEQCPNQRPALRQHDV